jgi:hypothetical protein
LAVGGEVVEDLVGGLGPDEWLRVGVPFVDPFPDVGFEFDDGAVGGAAEFAGGEFGEPAFDEVEPGRAGGGEVQVAAGVEDQPLFDLGCLVVA